MGFSLPDDIGYPTTKGYVKRHNRRSRKILKRDHSKKNRRRPFDSEEIIKYHSCKHLGVSTRDMSEKDHHLMQRCKDIDRTTIRKCEA